MRTEIAPYTDDVAENKTLAIPPKFVASAALRSSDELVELADRVRRDLDEGASETEVADALAAAGWEREFIAWYVHQAAGSTEVLVPEVGIAAYPRQRPKKTGTATAEELELVAFCLRKVEFAVIAWVIGPFVLGTAVAATESNLSGPGFFAISALTQAAGVFLAALACSKAPRAAGMHPVVMSVLGFASALVPCCGLLYIAWVSGLCTEYLRKNGVKVGFFGLDRRALREQLEARRADEPKLPEYGPHFGIDQQVDG